MLPPSSSIRSNHGRRTVRLFGRHRKLRHVRALVGAEGGAVVRLISDMQNILEMIPLRERPRRTRSYRGCRRSLHRSSWFVGQYRRLGLSTNKLAAAPASSRSAGSCRRARRRRARSRSCSDAANRLPTARGRGPLDQRARRTGRRQSYGGPATVRRSGQVTLVQMLS